MKAKSLIVVALIALSGAGSSLFSAAEAAPAKNNREGFEIKVKVANYPDSMNHVLLLGRYNWSAQYITDSAKYDPKTKTYVFSGDKPKEGGMYLLITPDKQYVDFIFDKDQFISIEMEYPSLFASIKFTGSPENDAYQKFTETAKTAYQDMNRQQAEYRQVDEAYKQNRDKADSLRLVELREEISKSYKQMEKDRDDFIANNPGNLMAAIFLAQKEPEIPDAPEGLTDSEKNNWQFEYYENHYFDNFDLCDDRLLRTPLFHKRVKDFNEKIMHMQSPDSIKYAWERLIDKAECNKELFKMLVWYPVDEYQRSEIIGHDAVWVHLAKKYYLGGKAYWASNAIVENFRKRIERVEPLLIGNVPQEFYCPDSTVGSGDNTRYISVFSSPKRYSVIIFWSITCGHCKKAMPKWYNLYKEKGEALDFEVFAICKDFDVPAWKKFVNDHHFDDWVNLNGKESNIDYNDAWDITTTPTVYVIDRQHRIVTKKIDPEYLEDFLKNWQQTHYPDETYPLK